MSLLQSLNSSQRAAVENDECASLVIAGPGSGKTRTLIAKVFRNLERSQNDGSRVLALTFTNKAAREMLDRLESTEGQVTQRCLASTFHSFGCEVLRQHGHLLTLSPDFTIVVDDDERKRIVQSMSDEDADLFSSFDSFSAFRGTIEEIGKNGGNPFAHSASISRYAKTLIELNRLDIDFVLPLVNHLLGESNGIQQLLRLEFPFVCVDEFQDTNSVQMEFLRLVAPEAGAGLFVVADDDQLIYAWNGASVSRLEEVQKAFSPRLYQLPENYRCSPEILEFANRLIDNNDLRDSSKLPLISYAESCGGESVAVYEFDSEEEEMEWIASDIEARYGEDGGRVAVLFRTRRNLVSMQGYLNGLGVPSSVVVRQEEFLTPEFRWLQTLLKSARGQKDSIAIGKLSERTDAVFETQLAHRELASLSDWREELVSSGNATRCIADLLEEAFDSVLQGDSHFLDWVLDAVEGMKELGSDSEQFSIDLDAWREITSDLEMQFGEGLNLDVFNQELDMRSKAPSPPENAVAVMTIHGAKGLEFEHVYVAGMQEGTIPYYKAVNAGDSSSAMEEERRACFVAITRAETRLTLTFANTGFGYVKQPSRFIEEMGLSPMPGQPV